MGATDVLGRLATSIFQQEALPPAFQCCHDVPNGGVLLALPALIAVGLLAHAEKHFQLPPGFYRLDTVFLLLAFMALARLKTLEDLRYCPPGEWGKLLGIDRAPEVKTLRGKVSLLAEGGEPQAWAAELCREWMAAEPDSTGILYVDGHVRVYSGKQTELPRHYVSRQKLCLRATVDYWVNAMDGRPFFVVNKAVDPGLLQVLEDDIVPRLESAIPVQPSGPGELFVEDEAVPHSHRFTLVFDREGYSPGFMKRMCERRIACLTYNKFPGDDWPEEQFQSHRVTLEAGNVIEMRLAERGVRLSSALWVREIRKVRKSGQQTSILATDFTNDCGMVAAAMFARWSQENFFKYMRQHYNLDRLVDYSTEEISATTKVVNPQYRELDGEIRKAVNKLNRKRKEFGAIMLNEPIKADLVEAYQQKKAALQEEIATLESEIKDQKACRSAIPKHVSMAELPKEERFRRLATEGKCFVDTIKMIAYRAETAMLGIVREKMSRQDDGRALLRAIYDAEADIVPDNAAGTLTVRLHHLANRMSGETVRHLCEELNATQTQYPGTEMRLIYELVS